MKLLLLFTIYIAITFAAIAQCSSTTAKIQSPVAPKPAAPTVTFTCSNVLITWQGTAKQQYELNVTIKDAAGNILSNAVNTNCTKSGGNSFTATIPTSPGNKVRFALQGISMVDDRTFYSYPLRSKEYTVPACETPALAASTAKEKPLQIIADPKAGINIYPNPVQSILHIAFANSASGTKTIQLFNTGGRTVRTQDYHLW